MCFIIDEKHRKKKIAKNDIVCYKELFEVDYGLSLYSPYQMFRYELGKLYKSEIVLKVKGNIVKWFEINGGLHSYSNKKRCKPWKIGDDNTYVFAYKAIIPKGSEYYYNSIEKEYVSNQLIVIEKL